MQFSQSGTRIEASTADYLLTDWVYWCGDAYLVRSISTNWWQFLATAWRPLSVTRLHPLRLRCVSCAHIEASLYSGVSVTCTFQYRDSLCRLGLCEINPMMPASVTLHSIAEDGLHPCHCRAKEATRPQPTAYTYWCKTLHQYWGGVGDDAASIMHTDYTNEHSTEVWNMHEVEHHLWQAFKFKDSTLLPCKLCRSLSVTSTANSRFTTCTSNCVRHAM